MGTFVEIVTVAKAAVGDNIATGKKWERVPHARRLVRIGLVGGATVGECKLGVYYGTERVMEIFNTVSGANKVPDKTDVFWHSSKLRVFPNVPVQVKVLSAPTTNPIVLLLDFVAL